MVHHLVGNFKRGLAFVISAPAGTGKTTLVHMLMEEFPDHVEQSISCTTRPPRKGEIDGKDYYFLTEKVFEEKAEQGEFLEQAIVFGHKYGMLRKTVDSILERGKHALLVIDTQGAKTLKTVFPAHFIFIAPPEHEVLKNRLQRRNTESEEMIQKRLEWAKHELEQIKHYNYLIINDDLNIAYQVLRSIIIAEEHRLTNQFI